MHQVAASQLGEVVIACVPSAVYYFLPKVLRDYHEQYPRIRVRIIDDSANAVLESVARGEADFGINIIGTQDPEIEFQAILKEPFVAACRRDHPLASKRKVTWAELVEPTVDRTVGLIRRRGRELPPAAQKLYQLIEKTWPQRLLK